MLEKLIAKKTTKDALSCLILGEAGVGKTSAAIHSPDPWILDLEGGAKRYGSNQVKRVDGQTFKWSELVAVLDLIAKENQGMKTLIIDSADYASQILHQHIVDEFNIDIKKDTLNSAGKGFGHAADVQAQLWRRDLVQRLNVILQKGVHVIVICHVEVKTTRKINSGEHDKAVPRLPKKLAPMLTEWAEFIGYLDIETTTGEDGSASATHQRVMHLDASPGFTCKNRFGLTEPLINPTFNDILHITGLQ